MQFFTPGSSKIEVFETRFFDVVTTQNDLPRYVKHVLGRLGHPGQLKNRSHLEERLLDEAQARASYTPLFWGRSRSIPQCMVSNI